MSEVHVLIRGDLYSMQYEIVSSEITGRVTGSQISRHRQGMSCLICEIRNKEGRQEMMVYDATLRNRNGETTEVSRSHSSQMPRVMPWTW